MLTAGLLTAGLLTACSGEQAATPAQYLPPAEAQSRFGDIIVRYNALPTLSLAEATAADSGLPRDADTAMVIVAVRRQTGSEELPQAASVTGVASDLSGKRQPIAFRDIAVAGYQDHVGQVTVSRNDHLRFELQVTVEGKTHRVQFDRGF
ncbi:hypothetical protein ABB29_08140 [Pseudoxanthomonas dokdonensis]|uniref:DUF4426 domain-containing protein n=1 Tax=Pseudoxanthomonas dokdonensis TaxID=344882 RepID=A0A0R0CJW5_9GAMM|nr:hypothetical protein ABB29_08140 [Pseudoxanthomonas dokdonensis]